MTDEPPVKVKYHEENRFEGKSHYFHYYPTGSIVEQRLETVAWEHQNRKLQEKRRDEETKHMVNAWSHARSRMEAEI